MNPWTVPVFATNPVNVVSVDGAILATPTVYVFVDKSSAVTVINIVHVCPAVKVNGALHDVIVAYAEFLVHVILNIHVHENGIFVVE